VSIVFILAILISIFLAFNIGANNSAAEMSAAYGAGIRTKREALTLILVFAFLGAVTAGSAVIKTMGKGLVPASTFANNVNFIFLVLAITAMFIFLANMSKVPIATTHAIVASIAGVGFYLGTLNTHKFFTIIIWWLVTPFLAFTLSFILGRFFYNRLLLQIAKLQSEELINKIIAVLVTLSGCYVAYSAGANNSANSVGPLVGAGILSSKLAAYIAGLSMGIGAVVLGGRVLETVGTGLTEICSIRAIFIEVIGATIILIASLKGIPVSLGEIITMSVMGFGYASCGVQKMNKNENVRKIFLVWVSCPTMALALSFTLSYFLK